MDLEDTPSTVDYETQSDLDEMTQKLAQAVCAGDVLSAQNIVTCLAQLRLKLDIDIPSEQSHQTKGKPFKLTVQVEDREAAGASFDILVRSNDRIEDLKRKVWLKYKFPMKVQRWIIGNRIPEDAMTLQKYGVVKPMTLFLYLLPAHSVGLRRGWNGEGDELQAGQIDPSNRGEAIKVQSPPGYRLSSNESTTRAEPVESGDTEEEDDIKSNLAASAFACDFWTPSELLKIGDRVIWPSDEGPERATVMWIGKLQDVEGDDLTVGVQFDNKVGVGTGKYQNQHLFYSPEGYAALIPIQGLLKETD